MEIRSRLAPSPTGYMHLGNIWSFLLCWLLVRSEGGKVVLRMEDIDPARSKDIFEEGILEDLKWLGLDWDEGPDCGGGLAPYRQSERMDAYEAALMTLQDKGVVYACYCTRKELRELAGAPHGTQGCSIYPGICRSLPENIRREKEALGRRPSMRLLCPDEILKFQDIIHGSVQLSIDECGGDFPVRRSDGVFAYQLAVVVDDIYHGITHIVRGDDILHCTPRQVLLYELLGGNTPKYAHIPLVLDHEGERLAKRHQSLEVRKLREIGVKPESICGYLAFRAGLISSPHPVHPQDLIADFQMEKVVKTSVMLPENIEEVLLNLS